MALYNSQNISGVGVIDGSTITPTDVVATWLECAGLHQSYTTLNEVLADSGVLSALMASTNAVDYLVRSTTWAATICADELAMNYIGENNYCADVLLADSTWNNAICNSTYFEEVLNGLVPAMTSNTTPSGVVSASNYDSGYEPYKAFDGNNNTFWYYSLASGSSISASITYDFGSDTKIYKAYIKAERATGVDKNYTFRVQGSADGVNYSNLTEDTTIVLGATDISKEVQIIIPTPSMYRYYRVLASSNFKAIAVIRTVQFYGRLDLPPVDDRINAKADKTDIAPVESGTTASRAYAVGQQFYLNGSLYKAKAAIAQGATFTIGTNCEAADCITEQIDDASVIYSTTERKIGRWTTGEDLYEITLTKTEPNSTEHYIDVTSLNIKNVVYIDAVRIDSSANSWPANANRGGNPWGDYQYVGDSKRIIFYKSGATAWQGALLVCTIRYTKN